ncbi:IS1595 family transposase [soil metagenome]
MSKSVLSAKHFHDEEAAYAFIEARLWPHGPVCPHCGGFERISKMKGASTRLGLYKCYQCRKPFRVTVGSVFEASHIKLHIWLQAIALMSSSKKGISSNQLHRTLGIGLKAAWFLSHRIREAMREGELLPMGAAGEIIEADETYLWKSSVRRPSKQRGNRPFTRGGNQGPGGKRAIVSLVQRGGKVRSFHVENADKATASAIVFNNIAEEARVMTDESRIYNDVDGMVSSHETVKHRDGEYVRGDVHTNSAEGFFSIFKRGMKGIYQQCSEKHLHRYLAEFDFRYSNRVKLGINDQARADRALLGVVGKRLTYRTIN